MNATLERIYQYLITDSMLSCLEWHKKATSIETTSLYRNLVIWHDQREHVIRIYYLNPPLDSKTTSLDIPDRSDADIMPIINEAKLHVLKFRKDALRLDINLTQKGLGSIDL